VEDGAQGADEDPAAEVHLHAVREEGAVPAVRLYAEEPPARLDVVRSLAERSGVALLAHPAFAGSYCGETTGLAPELLFGDLFRLAGADAVIFPNAGGRFPFSLDDCRRIEGRLRAPLGGAAPSFLMLGGGIDAALLAQWIPRYSRDTIWLIGGSLYANADLRAAAREMVEVARRAAPRPPEPAT